MKKFGLSNFDYKKSEKSGDFLSSKPIKIKTESNGVGITKTVFTGLSILLSLTLFILIQYIAVKVFYWYLGFSFFMSILTSIFILSSNKHGLSKAVWILFVLLTFYFGYVIYFLADERIFFRKSRKKYDKIFEKTSNYLKTNDQIDIDNSVINDANYLLKAGGFNAYNNTKLDYFSSGESFFCDVINNIKNAKSYIFIEFFIISKGVLWNKIFNILKEKAKDGVDVRIIYDGLGSHKSLPKKLIEEIKKSSIKILPFNRLVPYFSVALNYRDHRKIIVIDGEIAYTGGCNLADEYIGEKRIYGYWKDNGVKLSGSAVNSFVLIFLRQWSFLSNQIEDYKKYLNKYDDYPSNSIVIPYADGLDYKNHIGKSMYENIICASKEKLYIMTPYLILDETMTDLIKNRAMSGVDVRIILPSIPDKKLVYTVTRENAEKLIKSGVKVYYMKGAFVHTKAVLTENSAITGSINMDLRSFYQQFECAIYTNDICFMKDLENDFIDTIKKSEIVEKQTKNKNLLSKLYTAILQIFAPFM